MSFLTRRMVGIFSALLLSTTLIFAVGGDYDYSSHVTPSQNPPAGLNASEVPQFIVFGSDDNGTAAGMKFVLDYIEGKTNPKGTGSVSTYDGEQISMSFYSNTIYFPETGAQHVRAKDLGCELSVHTMNHYHGGDSSQAFWENEMQGVVDTLVKYGISKSDIKGFRTPFLEWNQNTFSAETVLGFTYDCSINEGTGPGQYDQTAANYYWPYTLDNSSNAGDNGWWATTYNKKVGNHSGLWELPCYLYMAPPDEECSNYGVAPGFRADLDKTVGYETGGKITGLDYNLWANPGGGFKLDKAHSIAVLKYTLDQHYNGNRTPFTIGMHSQFYDPASSSSAFPNVSAADRQEIFKAIVDYALTKPDVRIVSGSKVIAWLMNPKALGGSDTLVDTTDNGSIDTTNPSGNLAKLEGAWEALADDLGSTVDTGSAIIQNGVVTAKLMQVKMPNDSTYPWTQVSNYLDSGFTLDGVTAVKVTYKSTKDMNLTLDQTPLSDMGESYQIALPKAPAWTTKYFAINDKVFSQPSGASSAALDLAKVKSLSFVPALSETANDTALIEIQDFVLFNYKGGVVDTISDTTQTDTNSTVIDTTHPSDNYANAEGYWEALADDLGSTVDTGSAIIQNGVVTTKLMQIKMPNDSTYPWTQVSHYLDSGFSMEGVTAIKVTYKSTKNLNLSLDQAPLSDNGESYVASLAVASAWKTVYLKVDSITFKQPSWAETKLPLDLKVVTSLSFLPEMSETANDTCAIEIKEFVLYNYAGTSPISISSAKLNASSLAINSITKRAVSFSVPSAGHYSVDLYAVNGKLVSRLTSGYFEKGIHSVTWNGSAIGNSLYLAVIKGNGMRAINRIVIR